MAFPLLLSRYRNLEKLAGGESYILHDEYTTDRAAGAVNGTLAEPGGTGTVAQRTRNVTDSAGTKLSITGARAVIASATAAGDPRLYYGPFTRTAGLTAKQVIKVTSRAGAGWDDATNPGGNIVDFGLFDFAGVLTVNPPNVNYPLYTTGVDYTLWTALFATGGALWMQGGVYTNPTLLWVSDAGNATPLYYFPLLTRTVNASEADNVQIAVNSSLASAAAIATVSITNPANGVNYTSTADALHYLTFTLPGSPSNGDKIELRYRYQDATNYWSAYAQYNGGTTQWDFLLDEVLTSGTTNKITVANIGNAVDICVVVSGNTHDCFTRTGTTWTKRGAQITDASLNTATEVGAWYAVGSCSLLRSFRRTWSLA